MLDVLSTLLLVFRLFSDLVLQHRRDLGCTPGVFLSDGGQSAARASASARARPRLPPVCESHLNDLMFEMCFKYATLLAFCIYLICGITVIYFNLGINNNGAWSYGKIINDRVVWYRYHSEVSNNCLIIACFDVFYSSYSTVNCQLLHFLFTQEHTIHLIPL